jgi:hypothetical protein
MTTARELGDFGGVVTVEGGNVSIGTAANLGAGVAAASVAGRVDALANGYGTFVARSGSSGANVDVIALKATDSGAANFANAAYQARSHVWGYNGATLGMVLDNSGNFQFNSGYGSVATAYGCRAWVNFNGTGTVAIRASGNVSSITDNGTGDYTANFTNAMPDANYSAVGTQGLGGISLYFHPTTPFQTSGIRVVASNGSGNGVDAQFVCVSVFR